jgi:4-hydroxy-3-methylbut-2-enyl diphosphate reductase
MSLPAPVTLRHLEQGAVLVASELIAPGRPPIPCPAAPLLAGDLRRRGVTTVLGPLPLDPVGEEDPLSTAVVLAVTVGQSGLGVATARAKGYPLTSGTSGGPGAHGSSGASGDSGSRSPGAARVPDRWATARSALAACLSVTGPRTVLLASPRSFCAGVERAIEVVERALARNRQRPDGGGPVYVRKQIVHNAHVVADLEALGAVFVDELDAVPDGATVVFSAHGVSPEVHAEAVRRELEVIDATCPLVSKVHVEARRFAARGDTVVLIGHAGHEEVEGTMGEAPEQTVLVESIADVERLQVRDPARVSYLTQTTLAVDETTEVIEALQARFPALRGPSSDDICYATTNRQEAVKAIVAESDLVLVVGSENSSNSRRLVELARRHDTRAELIDDVGGIHLDWLDGARVVGLTAGASAPPGLVEDVIAALAGLGPLGISETIVAKESVRFTLPSAVRPA